ncbi:CPBP family intramembrane metalloprotease [Hoyosella sp. YIM 151337]|uniref:CPBP family intramembrane glutamic endopeptidase n=1 Tax=Hoyosella sp. YIM 151337 TaxID=2992742 RepID=UPI00223647B9|nr:CPBP family intramembrane glutamic endopeptidase [Hoyosella sp. YIM 151337]MCW4354912.1 CPBP family intramembrane metalloprotease [Hoyosella sp. YIM 151337]
MNAVGRRAQVRKYLAGAGALSAALLAWNNAALPGLRWPPHWRAPANAAVGVAAVAAARAAGLNGTELRLSFTTIPSGVRTGMVVAALPAVVFTVAGVLPRLRGAIVSEGAVRDLTAGELIAWVAYHIPVGTVLCEELAFRAALDPMLERVFTRQSGDRAGRAAALLTSAAVFGLWHVVPARASGDPVVPTVLFTTAGGVVFTLLARRSGSVVAPMIAHVTANAGGALLAARLRTPVSYGSQP